MNKVLVLTDFIDKSPYLIKLEEELSMKNIQKKKINISSTRLPTFDARKSNQYNSKILDNISYCIEEGKGLILLFHAYKTGCPSKLINLLQLIGGPSYDNEEGKKTTLDFSSVAVIVLGAVEYAVKALREIEQLVARMGGNVVVTSNSPDESELISPGLLLEKLNTKSLFIVNNSSRKRYIDMSLGDVQLPPSENMTNAVVRAAKEASKYTNAKGLLKLRELLANLMQQKHNQQINTEEIIITTGASMALYSSLSVLLKPGDTVLIPDPGFPNYHQLIKNLNLHACTYKVSGESGGFDINAQDLNEKAQNAKVIIWNSPHNPLGATASDKDLSILIDVSRKNGLTIISDEVYSDLVWEGHHISPLTYGYSKVLLIGSFSKIYAMSGYRLGWIKTPLDLSDNIARTHWAAAMSAPLISQKVAIALLEDKNNYTNCISKQLVKNRRFAIHLLKKHKMKFVNPKSGVFLWIDISETNMQSNDFVRTLLIEEGVIISAGASFGLNGEGWVRISYAIPFIRFLTGINKFISFYNRERMIKEGAKH